MQLKVAQVQEKCFDHNFHGMSKIRFFDRYHLRKFVYPLKLCRIRNFDLKSEDSNSKVIEDKHLDSINIKWRIILTPLFFVLLRTDFGPIKMVRFWWGCSSLCSSVIRRKVERVIGDMKG